MEKGEELFKCVVARRMFLDLRNGCWEAVQKRLQSASSEGRNSEVMTIKEICSTEDNEIVQNIIGWLQVQLPKYGIKVVVGIEDVEFSW